MRYEKRLRRTMIAERLEQARDRYIREYLWAPRTKGGRR